MLQVISWNGLPDTVYFPSGAHNYKQRGYTSRNIPILLLVSWSRNLVGFSNVDCPYGSLGVIDPLIWHAGKSTGLTTGFWYPQKLGAVTSAPGVYRAQYYSGEALRVVQPVVLLGLSTTLTPPQDPVAEHGHTSITILTTPQDRVAEHHRVWSYKNLWGHGRSSVPVKQPSSWIFPRCLMSGSCWYSG